MSELISLRLSELTGKINQVIKNAFYQQSFWVVADITNYSFQQNKKYHYFDLVEKDPLSNRILAKVQSAAFGAGSVKIGEFETLTGQKFRNDLHVLVLVSIDYHPLFGLKLILLDVDSAFSLGQLEKAKQETLRKLLAECADFIQLSDTEYITRNKQLKLPLVIQRIALVTSDSSAAIQDFKHTLLSNQFNYRFCIDDYFTLVQGEANAQAFYNKLLDVFNSGITYDLVVIIRGGGAQTDFLLFDQYIMGKIVAKFPFPILTGIGHHKDETIVDLMAHTATKTPTKAAEFILSHNRGFEEILVAVKKAIIIRVQQALSSQRQLLHRLNNSVLNKSRTVLYLHNNMLAYFAQITVNKSRQLIDKHKAAIALTHNTLSFHPRSLVITHSNSLNNISQQLVSYSRLYLSRQKDQLLFHESLTRMMSPLNILKKGFAIVYHDNKITSDPESIPEGAEINVRLADTVLSSTVNAKNKTNEEGYNL